MSSAVSYRQRWCLAVAVALVCAAGLAGPYARAGQVITTRDASAEMLQNGREALSDNQPDEARQFFERLIELYPSSPNATAAKRELERIESGDVEVYEPAEQRAGKSKAVADDAARRLKRSFVVDVGDRVFFAENSFEIGGRARAVIEAQARWLKLRPELAITVVGRADDGLNANDAIGLAKARAEAVRDKLVEAGLSIARINIESRGDKDPIATCRTALCQAQNRHAETAIAFSGSSMTSAPVRDSVTRKDASAASRPLTR